VQDQASSGADREKVRVPPDLDHWSHVLGYWRHWLAVRIYMEAGKPNNRIVERGNRIEETALAASLNRVFLFVARILPGGRRESCRQQGRSSAMGAIARYGQHSGDSGEELVETFAAIPTPAGSSNPHSPDISPFPTSSRSSSTPLGPHVKIGSTGRSLYGHYDFGKKTRKR